MRFRPWSAIRAVLNWIEAISAARLTLLSSPEALGLLHEVLHADWCPSGPKLTSESSYVPKTGSGKSGTARIRLRYFSPYRRPRAIPNVWSNAVVQADESIARRTTMEVRTAFRSTGMSKCMVAAVALTAAFGLMLAGG